MRLRRSLWVVCIVLAAGGIAWLLRGQGQPGTPPSTQGRPPSMTSAGLPLEGAARAPSGVPLPDAPAQAPSAPPTIDRRVTDDGETYSVLPEAGQEALTLRLTALGSGEALSVSEWVVAGTVYAVPPGRVPRMPVLPGKWLSVRLAGARHGDGSWRFLSEQLAVEAPLSASEELRVAVPTLEDLTHDPVWVIPVQVNSGVVLPGGTWEPPPQRSDLKPIAADADGRIAVPLAVLRSTLEEGVGPYHALLRGLMVPDHHVAETAPALTPPQLRQLSGTGELRVPLWSRAGQVAHQLRLIEPDGAPASSVRVVVQHYPSGTFRQWTDARGILTWQGTAGRSSHVKVFSADGWLREIFELPVGAGRRDEPARLVLPDTALVTLEFVLPDRDEASRDSLPRRLEVGIFGRRYPPEGDPEPPVAGGVPERVDNTGGTILETQLDFNAPRVRLRLPLRRELQVETVIAPTHPAGHGHSMRVDFDLDGSERRLVFDWPPTRILSREDR